MNKLPAGRWSKAYECCQVCGTTLGKNWGKGLCRACYFQRYNEANKEAIQGHKRKWYDENITPEFQKAVREQLHFGGLRETILERDGHRCSRCGRGECQLVVHHRDGNGRGKASPTNEPANLQSLCRACHMAVHRHELEQAKANKRKVKR